MQCPTCNHLNTATDVRCFQCGTTLIHEAVGHSPTYIATVDAMDLRMYRGIGGFFGFFVTAGLLKTVFSELWLSDREVYGYSVGGAFLGALLGRLFLRFKRRGY